MGRSTVTSFAFTISRKALSSNAEASSVLMSRKYDRRRRIRRKAKGVAQTIVDVAKALGVAVDWDGDPDHTIVIGEDAAGYSEHDNQ